MIENIEETTPRIEAVQPPDYILLWMTEVLKQNAIILAMNNTIVATLSKPMFVSTVDREYAQEELK